MEMFHTPVLLEETIHYLAPRKEGELMVDATLGEGGHGGAFLERFPTLRLVGIDADEEIQERARRRLDKYGGRVRYYNCWSQDFFSSYPADLDKPDTILFDLGISLYHYEKSNRGFSFLRDEYLDMRIDRSRGKTAADLIASLGEKELADLLYFRGGERHSRRIAAALGAAKKRGPVSTTAALADLVSSSVPGAYRRGPIHPATRTFMALRIAVNGEVEGLPALLENALGVLKAGGRMGVISFHSGEDREVKHFFRQKNKDCTCPPEAPICRCGGIRKVNILTRKVVCAGEEERRKNPPSRSAKFRAVEKIHDSGVHL
ncbi:MAG: 16S rRNA (cytosine(1402)-N(4))-methyltransferase RsmH [Spirochaetaceae bacterium]|jgi:16S rRNA (cytosine1402-N4)-methyltransferase|nr:16S rRNA (cytosine(1402)-N(4))-methyltransferase RsmH [Spirochaetaceae bacterium]